MGIIKKNVRQHHSFNVAQGACTDGHNIYCVFEQRKTNRKIVVYDTDGNQIRESKTLNIGHGNGIAYKNGMLYIVHSTDDNISVVDARTLKYVKTIKIKWNKGRCFNAIASTQTGFVLCIYHKKRLALVDARFNKLEEHKWGKTYGQGQGITVNGNKIYRAFSRNYQQGPNTIGIYTMKGKNAGHVRVPYSGEIESVFFIRGVLHGFIHHRFNKNGKSNVNTKFFRLPNLKSVNDDSSDADNGYGAIQRIIDVAKKHVGKNGRKWVQQRTSIGGAAWCGATMCACAIDAGFAGKIMPKANYSAGGFGKDVVQKYKGKYIKGGANADPQPGDFAEFHKGRTGKWASGHVGLVIKVNKKTVRTIEGNHLPPSGEICYVTRKKTEIGWYARPNWDKVGGPGSLSSVSDGDVSVIQAGPLYDTASTRSDAMLREVAFMDNDGVATTKTTDTELSVLNYTSTVAAIYSLFGGEGDSDSGDDTSSTTSGDYDLSGIKNSVAKRIVKFFVDAGFSPSGACAIVGNMQQESSLKPSWDDGTNFGLCNWTNDGGRANNMKKHAGSDWKKDVEGQCSFILKELKEGGSGYKKLLKQLKENKDSESWCKELTEKFCTVYERAGIPMMSNRKKYAVNVWKKIKKKKAAKYEGGKFKWPCPGHKNITSKFGPRSAPTAGASSYHRGIDISASIGDKVIAAASGKVIEVKTSSSRGNYITISHGSKLYTRYQHLSKQSVKKGDKVNEGDTIGKVGNTGVGTGAHLHFEVLKGGYTGYGKYEVDPMKYLK